MSGTATPTDGLRRPFLVAALVTAVLALLVCLGSPLASRPPSFESRKDSALANPQTSVLLADNDLDRADAEEALGPSVRRSGSASSTARSLSVVLPAGASTGTWARTSTVSVAPTAIRISESPKGRNQASCAGGAAFGSIRTVSGRPVRFVTVKVVEPVRSGARTSWAGPVIAKGTAAPGPGRVSWLGGHVSW